MAVITGDIRVAEIVAAEMSPARTAGNSPISELELE